MTYRDELAEIKDKLRAALDCHNFDEAGRLHLEEKRLEREALTDRQWAQEHGEEVS